MNADNAEAWENRLQETEIKLAFLDKELEDYKDAVQTLHARLELLEKTVAILRRSAQAGPSGDGSGGE